MGWLSEVSCTICYQRHYLHHHHQQQQQQQKKKKKKKLKIRFNLNMSELDWRVGPVFILFQKISWGWHPGAETCRGLIVVMKCILWFVLYFILLSVFGWYTKCRNMHGTGTHNSCFTQFTKFLYIRSPCTDYTVTTQIIYPRSLLWRRWHWHLMVDSTHTYILLALTFCKICT